MAGFSAAELGAKVGVSARTVRYYTAQRVLPAAVFRGAATRYLREHLIHLAAIRALQRDQRLSLSAIRKQLESLSIEERERLAGILLPELAPPSSPSAAAPSAPAVNDVWYRLAIVPGLEIHCHAATSPEVQALARAIVERVRAGCA
ncbi:MAG TPA: MerR family transcriptional regulator [Polyangiaceae bacterium]|nr:MerR family transcriptional regulator [Polyangiaceae bacterium]